MLRLSQQQVHAFEDREAHQFAKRVAKELPGYRGPLVANRSEASLYAAASMGVERGRSFGLTSERALFQYVNLTVTLGIALDSDPALPWAHPILLDDSYLGNEKMDDLWNAYIDYCGAVMEGGEGEYFPRQALRRLKDPFALPNNDGTLAPLLRDLEAIWPEKAGLIGPDAMEAHAQAALQRAAELGFRDSASQASFCRIAFVLGYAFDSDPLHGWVSDVLSETRLSDERDAVAKLESRFAEMIIDPCLSWQENDETFEDEEET